VPTVRPAIDVAPGTPLGEVDTPALLLDLDRFDRNVERLMSAMRASGVGWRPHSKAHKSPVIAQMQIAAGAHGITCAKVSEAEVMVAGGVASVLIANEPARASKWERIAALQADAEVIACVDAPEHLALASAAGVAAGVEIPVLVELDIGMDRCGIAPGAPAVELAKRVADAPGVRLRGAMGYEGHLLTLWPHADKEAAVRESVARLTRTADEMRATGLPIDIVSSGGSGSYMTTATVPGVTELQAGGACFMDRFYGEECHLEELGFEYALHVVTTVSGRPTRDRAILDGGFKTMSDRGEMKPIPLGVADSHVVYLSAEHTNLHLGPGAPDLRIGDRVTFLPEYSDTTTFRHDAFVVHRNGVVEAVIPLAARGRLT
jgi:D-serine deaminase-like pyridoxal phosphate-dependent protein